MAAEGTAAPRVAVVDYHKGNLSSVARGLAAAGAAPDVTDDPSRIASAEGVVIPGVGSFEDAMAYISSSGQADAIRDAIGRGVPFLGICLGLQVLFDEGCERSDPAQTGTVPGLEILRGSCIRLVSSRLKVPHVGWDAIDITPLGRACPLLQGVQTGSTMYFTHSYVAFEGVEEGVVAARTHYVESFPSVVWSGNVFGCQFHPEKSSANGVQIMRNFVGLVAEGPDAAAGAATLAGAGEGSRA